MFPVPLSPPAPACALTPAHHHKLLDQNGRHIRQSQSKPAASTMETPRSSSASCSSPPHPTPRCRLSAGASCTQDWLSLTRQSSRSSSQCCRTLATLEEPGTPSTNLGKGVGKRRSHPQLRNRNGRHMRQSQPERAASTTKTPTAAHQSSQYQQPVLSSRHS